MRIIDAHMHLGEDLMFITDDTEEILLKAMDDHGIAAQVVQPGIVSRDQKKAHERIRRFAAAHPGRIFGLTCFNPLMDDEEYLRLVRWTAKELGFKGVKLHPNAFCMAPSHPAAQKIFRVAQELDIVVMIHTGNGLPNALPSLCIPVARKYPDVRIVLAHAGGGTFGADAIVTAQECPNIYLETSWVTRACGGRINFKISPQLQILFAETLYDVQRDLFRDWWSDVHAFVSAEAAAGSSFAAQCLKELETNPDPRPGAGLFHYYCFVSVGRRDSGGSFVNRERLYDLSPQFLAEYGSRLENWLVEIAEDLYGQS